MLQLVEEGHVDLDATVDEYLPDRPHAEEITVRQLLTHTSGVPSWCDDGGADCADHIVGDLGRLFTLDEVLAFTRRGSAVRAGNCGPLLER